MNLYICSLCPATVCFLLLLFAFSVISGSDICAEHCKLERKGNRVVLYPLLGNCFVNHRRILKPKKLSQGKVYLQFWCLLCQDRAIPMHLKYEECGTTLLWCISNHLSPFCMVCLRGIYIQNCNFRLHYISCWLSSSSSIGNGWIGGSSQEPLGVLHGDFHFPLFHSRYLYFHMRWHLVNKLYVWQSWVEIKYFFVVYFDCITMFEVL